uniref:Uncharacterized protein n=1 Tax=Vespula pensylvanica TaxID=30213 RepID=A0A834PE70_VESPE|nr:hypothetical protein H0235_000617 [Vespula pensylvanica]
MEEASFRVSERLANLEPEIKIGYPLASASNVCSSSFLPFMVLTNDEVTPLSVAVSVTVADAAAAVAGDADAAVISIAADAVPTGTVATATVECRPCLS